MKLIYPIVTPPLCCQIGENNLNIISNLYVIVYLNIAQYLFRTCKIVLFYNVNSCFNQSTSKGLLRFESNEAISSSEQKTVYLLQFAKDFIISAFCQVLLQWQFRHHINFQFHNFSTLGDRLEINIYICQLIYFFLCRL